MHRQFALFEGSGGVRRSAQRGHGARQSDAKGSGAAQRPAAKIK
jgi:hypothetical protein